MFPMCLSAGQPIHPPADREKLMTTEKVDLPEAAGFAPDAIPASSAAPLANSAEKSDDNDPKKKVLIDYGCLPSDSEFDAFAADDKIDFHEEIDRAKAHPRFPQYIECLDLQGVEDMFGSPEGDPVDDLKGWVSWLRESTTDQEWIPDR